LPHQFCSDCIIATRGYDFREGQAFYAADWPLSFIGAQYPPTKNLKPNRERMQFIKDGEEIIPGVHAMLAPGHTVGHTIFMIGSGGKQLCYVGDLAHHPALLLQKPLTEFKYDTNPKQSAQSRAY
jgi:glyoxylase-like metal-dependent hydrolase (beta-lactamase superfamily II)